MFNRPALTILAIRIPRGKLRLHFRATIAASIVDYNSAAPLKQS